MNRRARTDAGKVYLILGRHLVSGSTISLANADYSFQGESQYDYAPGSLSVAGDMDGDGLHDFLIGADWAEEGESELGKVYLILGSSVSGEPTKSLSQASYTFIGENEAGDAGLAVSSAGDVDGDGVNDFIVGIAGNDEKGDYAGKVYLVLGSSLGDQTTRYLSQTYSFLGEWEDARAGSSVSGAGDVNGDGRDDLLVGALLFNEAGSETGKVYLILSGL